jgi:hypothetical protein
LKADRTVTREYAVGAINTTRLTELLLKNKKVTDEAKAGLCAHTRCQFSKKWLEEYDKKLDDVVKDLSAVQALRAVQHEKLSDADKSEAERHKTLEGFGFQTCPAAVATALSWNVARFFFCCSISFLTVGAVDGTLGRAAGLHRASPKFVSRKPPRLRACQPGSQPRNSLPYAPRPKAA